MSAFHSIFSFCTCYAILRRVEPSDRTFVPAQCSAIRRFDDVQCQNNCARYDAWHWKNSRVPLVYGRERIRAGSMLMEPAMSARGFSCVKHQARQTPFYYIDFDFRLAEIRPRSFLNTVNGQRRKKKKSKIPIENNVYTQVHACML